MDAWIRLQLGGEFDENGHWAATAEPDNNLLTALLDYEYFHRSPPKSTGVEEFNLACALRQSISNIFAYFPLLLLPAALLGIPPKVIAILAPVQLFLQFWYHTRHIGKLGWLEYIIVTPSQHRVHHA